MTTRLTPAASQDVRAYAATAPPMFRALLTAWLDERAALEAYESAMNGPDSGVHEDTTHEAAKMAFDDAVRDTMPDVYELLLKCDALRRERDEARGSARPSEKPTCVIHSYPFGGSTGGHRACMSCGAMESIQVKS